MAGGFVLLLAIGVTTAPAVALRDVPLGECYSCEVTCFQDCTLKYDREIMDFIQVGVAPEKKNRTTELTEQYATCLQQDNCPCPASGKGKTLELVESSIEKKRKCATGAMACSSTCGMKVVEQDIATLTKEGIATKKSLLQKKHFPLHSVKVNSFSTGKLTLDQCLKHCVASTCGCRAGPLFDSVDKMNKAVEEHLKSKVVVDTSKSPQYRPAKIQECAKGMFRKRVTSGLFIKLEGGPGGMYEICSKDFLNKIYGPLPDVIARIRKKCTSRLSDDYKWGCSWNEQKGKCVALGFSQHLTCQVKYFDDPTP